MKDTKQMHGIFGLAVKEIEAILKNKQPITERTQLSIASLGVYSRLKSAEVHERALEIMVMKYGKKHLPRKK